MTAPSLFYALHVLNPYRELLDQVGMCPDRPQAQQRLVRLVFLWTETAESLRRAEEALAVVGRDYGREINAHRKALARLHPDDLAGREHERAISLLERGGYETLTWRLMVAARDVERRRVALEDVARQLEGYGVGVPAAAD
jgi:hypothetical protein